MASRKGRGKPASGGEEGFEDVYRRLEGLVAKLEEGGLTLEQAIELYEEGMKMAQRCQAMLEETELRVTQLQEAFAAYGEPTATGEESPAYVSSEDEEEPPAE
jgi:exodeoxyribonuclease VII small subunit